MNEEGTGRISARVLCFKQSGCRTRVARFAIGSFLAFAVAPTALLAQSGESDEIGAGELATYAGGVFGIGSHPAVGGSTGVGFSRYGVALIDVSYMPLARDTLFSGPFAAAYRNSGLYDFDLCANIRIPVRRRWAPYGILGGGLLYDVYQAAVVTPGSIRFTSRSKTNFEFSTGGGVRYYVGPNWGIRPEVRVLISSRNFTRIAVGVFYDVGSDWPFRSRRGSNSTRHGRFFR